MTLCPVINEVTADYSREQHTSERKYIIRGVETRTAAENEVAGYTAGYDGDMIRKGWALRQIGHDTWEATVRYSSIPSLDIGESKITGTTKGGTFKTTHALEHRSSTAQSGSHPGHGGAINVTKDGIDGVEILLPTFTFSVTRVFAPGTVSNNYMKTLMATTTCMNDATWYGFAKGEILLVGVDFTKNLENETVTYDFECSPNQEDITVSGITVNGTPQNPAKYGWDYLWVEFREKDDPGTGHVVREPVAVHIERVYNFANFALLGI